MPVVYESTTPAPAAATWGAARQAGLMGLDDVPVLLLSERPGRSSLLRRWR